MKKIDENIYMKRLNYFNVYVIKGEDGDILIDTGFIGMKRRLQRFLDKFDIKLIILTHAHVDHAWNAKYLKERYNCEILMGKDDLINIDNSNVKSKPSMNKYKLWAKVLNKGMNIFKQAEFEPDILVEEDTEFNQYGLNFKIVNLTGHTNGSIGILYNDKLFAGDSLVNRKRNYVQIAFQNQNNESAKDSFKKIIDLNPQMIYIGHDKPIDNDKLMISYEREFNNYY